MSATDTTDDAASAGPGPDLETLWIIYTYIRQRWQAEDGMSEAQLKLIVDGKIRLYPDYAGYYAAAVTEYRRLLAQTGDRNRALDILYTENQLPNPKLPDVATRVLGEFMTYHVAFGGFRTYGFENFPGWMGGGSYQQVPPPYRTVNGETAKGGGR